MNTEFINLAKEIGISPIVILLIFVLPIIIDRIINLFKNYDDFQSRKINKLQRAIECPEMPDLELNRLKQLKVNEFYKQATGLKVGEDIRSDVIKLINELSINEKQINTIRFYLAKDQNDLKIDIKKWEWSFLYLSHAIATLSAIITSIVVLVGVILLNAFDFKQEIIKPILTMFVMSITVFFVYLNENTKYNIIQNIYKSHHHLFKRDKPNWAWKIGSIGLLILFIAINFWFKKFITTIPS